MSAPARRPRPTRAPAQRSGSRGSLRAVDQDWPTLRAAQIEEFVTHLGYSTNRRGQPYSRRTVGAYVDAIASVEAYLSRTAYAGTFADLRTVDWNRYLVDYRASHTQGGTVTKQGNLRVFCAWLAADYGAVNPFQDKDIHPATGRAVEFNRYARQDEPPDTLSPELIAALLNITSGRRFFDIRDHAIIRLSLSGMRLEEISSLRVQDVDLRERTVHTVGLKGNSGRVVAFGRKTAQALARWLRARGECSWLDPKVGPLWIARREQKPLIAGGIYQMLKRRVIAAGYPPSAIHPHQFRHTRAHDHLADGGSEGDLMRQMGWKSRSMVDRYAAKHADTRSVEDAHRRGLDDRY